MNLNKVYKNLMEIKEHFEALKKVDGSKKWDEYINKIDETENILKGAGI